MRRRPPPEAKYPVCAMAVGEVLTFPWPLDDDGAMDRRAARSLRQAMYAQAAKHKMRLRLASTLAGLRVERIR